jgi:hypothetical protein
MRSIPLTQGKTVLVDDEDYITVIRYSWAAAHINNQWYAMRTESPRLMHVVLTGNEMTDHINGNGLDNRRSNLQPTDHTHNAVNSRLSSNNQSGHKGIRQFKGRWRAQIGGNCEYLGQFDSRDEAISAYHAAHRRRYGTEPSKCGCEGGGSA